MSKQQSYGLLSAVFHRISVSDRAFLARQLAVMLDSGLPISQAVRSMIEQTTNPIIEEILVRVLHDLENGYRFSEAVKKHPKLFNQVFVAVVAAGEATGKLDVALNLLAQEQERDQGFRRRAIGALLYPAFIIGAMFIVGVIMVTRIVPALELVFREANVVLPWTTRLVVAITNSILNYWYVYILLIIIAVSLFMRYLASDEGKKAINSLFIKVPVFGKVISNLEMARFTRILAMMIQSGVPIIQALDAVSQVLDNVIYQEALHVVARNVERGAPISQSLLKFPVFPFTVTQMVAVGEQSGKLEQVLHKLADYYEAETDQSLKNLTALTEPVVFVIVGLGVAFLVFSIIVPIYNLASIIG